MLDALKCKTCSYIFIEPASQLLGGTQENVKFLTWDC